MSLAPTDEQAEPVYCLPLGKTDGEWILTQMSNGQIKIKLYGDSKGHNCTYYIKGTLGYLGVMRREPN